MRKLDINVSEDPFYRNPTSVGITDMLQWFASRTTSLQWVAIGLWAAYPIPGTKSVLHGLLPATDLPETLCAFNVTNDLQISIAGRYLSFPYHHYEKWPLYVAEKKDWVIHKYVDKVRRKGFDEPARTSQISWIVGPGKIMRPGDSDNKNEGKVVGPSHRIIKVTEDVDECLGTPWEMIVI